MASSKQTKGFLLGAIAGGIIGSVTALLFAPKAGKELRHDISEGARRVQEQTVRAAGQVSDTTVRIAKQIGNQATELADTAKAAAGAAVSSVRERRAELAGAAHEVADEAADEVTDSFEEAAEEVFEDAKELQTIN
ncbi:gas vesicle protein [Paenibacillus sp. BK033]|uniref:YtxH domain-containing protein n=1 Tax=Paenibacillus sp. BK033 TaxID=2512133 RepID=UPI0010452893|nr:YtxH domain-containing protein [Paenibacillus sp. BK033]TCN01415.1 gas vesicle protein [Paenibacillus sp. BK033]